MKTGYIFSTALENIVGFFYEGADLSPLGLVLLIALPTIAFVTLIIVLIDYFKE